MPANTIQPEDQRCPGGRMVDAGESAQCPRIERLEARFNPLAISALIANVLRLFLLQAQMILSNPLAIVLMAIPLILQTHLIYWITAF